MSAAEPSGRPFAARLLDWFDGARRDLPWRRTSRPWAIWVSEVMLQQTRVEVVLDKWGVFLERFPTPAACADASDDELQQAWRGLGYYRRARLLRDGARAVVADHGGDVPRSADELGRLPGIGTYTKGAIASIAFGEVVPAIDGNVERVIARHDAIPDDVKRAATHRRIRQTVLDRIDASRAGDFNQALMELGALICTPRNPRCEACPVNSDCEARARELTAVLPRLPARRVAIGITARAVLCPRDRGRVLAARVPAGEVNQGQLTLPGSGLLNDCEDANALAETLASRFDAQFEVGEEVARTRHGITHHRITLILHQGTLRGRRPAALIEVDPTDVAAPWSTATRKLFRTLGHG